ncbi:two-component system sensor histidine kinase SapS [Enterococcus dongliensis]|uniref:two-component system sensor histidine kinase SapS n=1 Tax=Enterococcus dongliensis TaxID=2559925 RepID=UPI002890DC96|nr:sensor histidine kinase [Enterococcus dongliensis]MDT2672975.1 sensor histidine kinase [Enterococcus dongliensis]
MTFSKYLKDRLWILLAWAVLSVLLIGMIWLTPDVHNFWDNLSYLLILQLFLIFLFFTIDYHRRKNWYQSFDPDDSPLQHFVESAAANEEYLVQEYVNQQVRQHHLMIEQLLSSQKDQKDYLDSWIHEIKVPLAAVDLILNSIEFDIPDDKFFLLQNELQQIDEYVEQILYYSRSDEFVNDYLIQEYSLKKVIQPIIRSQANYFIQKNLQLTLGEEDAKVLTDAKWIEFIFRQLLSNAIKYTPDHGQIKIHITTKAGGVELSLQDNGIGIPPEDIGRIFDKGFTGENGRTAQQHSTGLGLYLAKTLAGKLGVELYAKSTMNKGTTMTLFFPRLDYYHEER